MERYTLQQRIEIIKIHYKNGENLAVTVRKTKAFFGRREAPSRTAIQKLVEKFELLGQVSDVKNKTRERRSRTTENIAAVAQSVEENAGLSIPRRSLELGIPQTSLHRILHKDLGLKEKTENSEKANGRGKRGATPAVEEAAEPIKKAHGGKSKKPVQEETIEEEDEEQIEEEETAHICYI